MACRKGELREEGKVRNKGAVAAVPSVTFSDALLFTTMCIIGMPVDVHVKDGSVYSGIFHTASVDKDYAVVLKNARMMKKANLDANVVNGNLIETLIVCAEDLVQVVAKGVRLPSNGITRYVGGNDIEAAAGYDECLGTDSVGIKSNEPKANKKQKTQRRFSAKRENGFPHSCVNVLCESSEDIERLDATNLVKIEEVVCDVSVDGRQVVGASQEIQSNYHNSHEFRDQRITDKVQGSRLSTAAQCNLEDSMQHQPNGISSGCSSTPENQGHDRPTSHQTACTVSSPPKVSVASIPSISVKSESPLSASPNSVITVPPKGSTVKSTAKESKLNPGAKIFSPSLLHHKILAPPAATPNGVNYSYMQGTYTVAPVAPAYKEVDASSFAHSSVPVKVVPYDNVAFGHGANDTQYAQPIMGQVINRTHPFRYAGQYQNIQTGHGYMNPNPQNVVLGHVGSLVRMHPISTDVIQTAAGFSQAAARSMLAPHQVLLPKHQGNAPAQPFQLCINPPVVASGPQPFVMPNSIPMTQPLYHPVLRPISVPASNGFLGTKFA